MEERHQAARQAEAAEPKQAAKQAEAAEAEKAAAVLKLEAAEKRGDVGQLDMLREQLADKKEELTRAHLALGKAEKRAETAEQERREVQARADTERREVLSRMEEKIDTANDKIDEALGMLKV